MKKLAIIWAGPAWIYTSLLLKSFPWEVFLFEENDEIWKKLKLTGWGRMNVTNKVFWVNQFSSNEERLLNNFFKNPIAKSPEKIFQELWIEYFWQESRAILKSENAFMEVERLWCEIKKQENLQLYSWVRVRDIKIDEEWKFFLDTQIPGFKNPGIEDGFDHLVIATWWVYRVWKEESKDSIYSLVKNVGHTITKTTPSLSPLIIKENPFKELAWTSFKWILKYWKNQISDDILFTHKWLSWPAVLDFSSYLQWDSFEICFIPNLFCYSDWTKWMEEPLKRQKGYLDFAQDDNGIDWLELNFQSKIQALRNTKEKLSNFLNSLLPKKLTSFILAKAWISNDLKICELSKEKQKNLQKVLFHFPISWAQKMDYKFCWTTKWWVSLKEINLNNLESKIHKNLFFAWEVLDINWLCGGYNISFTAICSKIISENLVNKVCKN